MRISHTRPLKIQKEKHKATLFLDIYRIEGTVHLPVGGRITDFVNFNVSEGPFIPLTAAEVYTVDTNELVFRTEFMAVHRNQIRFLIIDKKEAEGLAPR